MNITLNFFAVFLINPRFKFEVQLPVTCWGGWDSSKLSVPFTWQSKKHNDLSPSQPWRTISDFRSIKSRTDAIPDFREPWAAQVDDQSGDQTQFGFKGLSTKAGMPFGWRSINKQPQCSPGYVFRLALRWGLFEAPMEPWTDRVRSADEPWDNLPSCLCRQSNGWQSV